MWFGTQIGLNRYDGYSITRFKHDASDEKSLSNDCITALLVDGQARLWVGTLAGLDLFRFETQTFEHFRHDSEDPESLGKGFVNALLEDPSGGFLWVETDPGGLWRFDPQTTRCTAEFPLDSGELVWPEGEISAICSGGNDVVWIGTNRGRLYRYPWRERRLEPIPILNEDVAETATISSIIADNGKVWVAAKATEPIGVVCVDAVSDSISRYGPKAAGIENLELRHVNVIFKGQDNALWFGGAERGLSRLNPGSDRFASYRHQPGNPYSLSDNTVFSIFQDQGGTVWVGTNSGVCRINPLSEVFHHLCHVPSQPNSLSHNRVKAIRAGDAGILWVGTYGGGLNRLDRDTQGFTAYRHDPDDPNSLSSDNVFAVHRDPLGRVWVGTFGGGLNLFDAETETFSRYGHDPDRPQSLRSDLVVTLADGPDGTLWVGTRDGLDCFDPRTGERRRLAWKGDGALMEDQFIRAIAPCRDGMLWIGTFLRGLFRCDVNSKNVVRYGHDPKDDRSLSHDYVACILEDRKGRFWLGTGGGLHLFDRETGHCIRFDEQDGLPDNMIYGVLEDETGCLWLSTSNGLSQFDPESRTFHNFEVRDGLQGQEFNSGAYCTTPSGALVFGGTNGLNWFFPSEVVPNRHVPEVVFTSLKKLNQEVDLEHHISLTREVVMDYRDKVFSFEFAALDFADPARNQYAYFMEGFHDNWVFSGTKREATFTNLDPGRYVFRVMGSNSDGMWNEQPTSIEVTVLPPPWKSWWAYGLYAMILAGLLAGGLYANHRKLAYERAVKAEAQHELEEKVAERTRELARKNVDLDVKNRELETLDRIVRTINREVDFSKVIRCLLEQGMLLFPVAKAAAFLSLDGATKRYRYTEAIGYDHQVIDETELDRGEVERLFLDASSRIKPGIRLMESGHDEKEPGTQRERESRLAITIRYHGEIEGLLLFDLDCQRAAFSAADTEKAVRFREHAVSAVAKAKTLNDLLQAQKALVDSAHISGMAEVATNVLHNVGNVLNSVMVSSQTIDEMVRSSRLSALSRANEVLRHNLSDISAFLSENPKGRRLLEFYFEIERVLRDQEHTISVNLADLLMEIETMREVITAQQRYATGTFQTEILPLHRVVEDAIRIQRNALERDQIRITRAFDDVPEIPIQKTKLIHIVINLLENAREAMTGLPADDRRLTISISGEGDFVYLRVHDCGDGIRAEDLGKIFRHGFTTKTDGFGFGLHSCANAMTEMDGRIWAESPGPGRGATLVLQFPIQPESSDHRGYLVHVEAVQE